MPPEEAKRLQTPLLQFKDVPRFPKKRSTGHLGDDLNYLNNSTFGNGLVMQKIGLSI
jgi:hypothetical protein